MLNESESRKTLTTSRTTKKTRKTVSFGVDKQSERKQIGMTKPPSLSSVSSTATTKTTKKKKDDDSSMLCVVERVPSLYQTVKILWHDDNRKIRLAVVDRSGPRCYTLFSPHPLRKKHPPSRTQGGEILYTWCTILYIQQSPQSTHALANPENSNTSDSPTTTPTSSSSSQGQYCIRLHDGQVRTIHFQYDPHEASMVVQVQRGDDVQALLVTTNKKPIVSPRTSPSSPRSSSKKAWNMRQFRVNARNNGFPTAPGFAPNRGLG